VTDRVASAATWERFRPTVPEVLYGGHLGWDEFTAPLAQSEHRVTPLEALETAIRPHLARPPCAVSFSGGRDSSLILCVAARLASREGWAAPVPVTLDFGGLRGTDESSWQELVVRHLGLSDWVRVSFTNELEAVGPVAAGVLAEFGVIAPPNMYLHQPLFDVAAGGSVLTGVAGDEVLDSGQSRLPLVLRGRARPSRRDLARAGYVIAPPALRIRALRRHRRVDHAWLRPRAQDWVTDLVARDEVGLPERWGAALRVWWTSRFVQGGLAVFAALAASRGAAGVHPYLDPDFLAALSIEGGDGGFATRQEIIARCFPGLLPDELVNRRDKAVFDAAVWGERVHAFAAGWDGRGVDPALVDADALRRSWLSGERHYRTLLLLHTAWRAVEQD
jgi:hypothetical protein